MSIRHLHSIFLFLLLPFLANAQAKADVDSLESEADSAAVDTIYPYEKAADGYYIKRMDVYMTVHPDHTFDVEESLIVDFTEERHGIYRSIPTGFWVNRDVSEAQDSSKYKMKFYNVDIKDLEVSEEFNVDKLSEYWDIRIGSAAEEIIGEHQYLLQYKLCLGDDRVKASDLFFHSVVGTAWNCAIDTAFFTIKFAKPLPKKSLEKLKLYIGSQGSEFDYRDIALLYSDDSTLYGGILKLSAYEGITVDMPLPEGYFVKGGISNKEIAAWIFTGLTAILLIIVIYKELQGNYKVTKVVSFRPSNDLSPADVGCIVDAHADDYDILSLIPWFASNGYIKIENQQSCGLTLHKLYNLPDTAAKHQKDLFSAFFEKNSVFHMNYANAEFGKNWQCTKTQLNSDNKDLMNLNPNGKWLTLEILSFMAFLYSSLICTDSGITTLLIGMFLGIFSAIVSAIGNFIHSTRNSHTKKGCSVFMSLGFFLFISFLLIGVMWAGLTDKTDYLLPEDLTFSFFVCTILVIIFRHRLLRMSPKRRELLPEILGLKEFIKTAEINQLRTQLEEDEQYFYRILPYALVFGLVDEWAEKFKDLPVKDIENYSNANVSQISHMLSVQPMMSNVAAATKKYNAQSSGGSHSSARGHSGGYSGGGSGGGGGRSW